MRQIWPLHPQPQPDELLSSWLMRIIMAYGMAPHTFCASQWPRRPIWNRDIDRCADRVVVEKLSKRTGQPLSRVNDMLLCSLVGSVFQKLPPGGIVPWLLSIGVYHRIRRLHGLQYCPVCLAVGAKPYYRKSWRLAFYTVCPVHHLPLQDSCIYCDEPVMPHRVPVSKEVLTICHACGRSLMKVNEVEIPGCWISSAEHIQCVVMKAIECGWVQIASETRVRVLSYLAGLRYLVRLLISGNPASRLRTIIAKRFDMGSLNQRPLQKGKVFECTRVSERLTAMGGLGYMMHNWPYQFVDICKEASIRYSDLFRTNTAPPNWLKEVAREKLFNVNQRPGIRKKVRPVSGFYIPNAMVNFKNYDWMKKCDKELLCKACVSWYRARRNSGIKPRTINRDLLCVYGFISYVEDVPWNCGVKDIDQWHLEIGQVRKLRPETQKTYLSALRSFLLHLGHQRWFRRNVHVSVLPAVLDSHLIPYAIDLTTLEENEAWDVTELQEISVRYESTCEEQCCPPYAFAANIRQVRRQHTHCDCCGRVIAKAQRVFEGLAYCSACYARKFRAVPCARCGKTVRILGDQKFSLCKQCKTLDRECIRCGKPVPRAGLTLDCGVACPSCAKHYKPPGRCANCGKVTIYLARDFKLGFYEPVCNSCRGKDNKTCAQCGKYRAVFKRLVNGKSLCRRCVDEGDSPFLCPLCGQEGKRHSAKKCEACYWLGRYESLLKQGLSRLNTQWVRGGLVGYADELKSQVGEKRAALRLKKYTPFFQVVDGVCDKATGTLDLDRLFEALGDGGLGPWRYVWRHLSRHGWVPYINSREVEAARQKAICRRILLNASGQWYGTLLEDFWQSLLEENRRWVVKGWEKGMRYSPRTVAMYLQAANRAIVNSGV